MKNNETSYIDLISGYFTGMATDEDIRLLEAWVKADPENREVFEGYARTWSLLEKERIETDTNLDLAWADLQTRRTQSPLLATPAKSRALFFRQSLIFRMAALFLLILLPALYAWWHFSTPATLTLTANRDVLACTLPDGTSITLNAGSTLRYPEKFSGETRPVSLVGEAYFQVAHNKDHPFIISSNDVRVKVLGTEFNMNTHTPAGKMEVVLTCGKVAVYFSEKPADPVLLTPGEKAEIPSNFAGISKSANDNPNYMAWKTLHFVFNDTPLGEVTATLSAAYHTPIRLTRDNLNRCRITATFDKQTLTAVLNVLKATLNLQIDPSGPGFDISGSPCR